MVLDVPRSSTSTATLAAGPASVASADPWDAPYFGGPVYFGYRPTLATATDAHAALAAKTSEDAAMVVETATTDALPADPWDAPYFGGQVYFRYADSRVDAKTPVATALPAPIVVEETMIGAWAETDGGEHSFATISSEVGGVLAGVVTQNGESEKRRGWVARFFRGELYIGRRG